MTCYYPLRGYRSRTPGKSGKYAVVFGKFDAYVDANNAVQVPCGQCIGCRLEYSRQWAVRCMHEASLYEKNCFITLTYNDDNLPVSMSLDKREFQLFMKRLRKEYGNGIRYFHCGEYGEIFGRPHYHACLFNFDFPDKLLWKESNGNRLYTSLSLSRLWPFGFSSIGAVTFESAAYVARYVVKKVTGERAKEHYTYIDTSTGEFYERTPEYTTMSRRPGIGKPWLDKFKSDVYPSDFVVMRGMKMKPPRYYDLQYEVECPGDRAALALRRQAKAFERAEDNTPQRLKVREKVKLAQISKLKRG